MVVSVLFCLKNSNYSDLGADVWDEERDAFKFNGHGPVICHPPCGQWGKLRHFAHQNEKEKNAGTWSIDLVNRIGGIVEHPVGSLLLKPYLKTGRVYYVDQRWFGHKAKKPTLLYCVGVKLLPMPILQFYEPYAFKNLSKRQRSSTPIAFAEWLLKACNHRFPRSL